MLRSSDSSKAGEKYSKLSNLQIVIDNTRKSDDEDELMDADTSGDDDDDEEEGENEGSPQPNMLEINDETESIEEEAVAVVDVDVLDETEFRVNLNKMPPNLQNTSLVSLFYLCVY